MTREVIGRFRVVGTLGSGGMGDVYRAYDPVLDRTVALKVLHYEHGADDAQRRRRIVREARAAAALTHANTVTIYEVGDAGDDVFIAMELLEGEDLRAALERGDASIEQKTRWLGEAARALAAAHERGLVHRDVKPENMFLCKNGTLKLLDFGIAKRDEDEEVVATAAEVLGPSSLKTAPGRTLGTPRYMAPEQHAGQATDARTDQYAWGLVAFELFTGSLTIDSLATLTGDGSASPGASTPAAARLAELRARVPELAEPIVLAIARALEPRKEDRFESMAPLVEALAIKEERAAPTSTPRPETPTAPPPATAPSRTHLWKLAAGAIALAAIAAIGVTTARRDRRSASAPRVAPPACRVTLARQYPLGAKDRLGLMTTGEVIVARESGGLHLERETPTGLVPFLPKARLEGIEHGNIELHGTAYGGAPALAVLFLQEPEGDRYLGGVLLLLRDETRRETQRIQGPVGGIAVASFRNTPIMVATTITVRDENMPLGVYLFQFRGDVRSLLFKIERSPAWYPALATTEDRVAIAYVTPTGMHFSLLDPEFNRSGDVLTVTSANSPPAVAFDGSIASVFWQEAIDGKSRIMVSTFTPGQPAFTPPRVAIDEAVADKAPITMRLSNGAWAVAWVAPAAGGSAVRISKIGPDGTLASPTAVATSANIHGLKAMSRDSGVELAWFDGSGAGHAVHVECTTP